ncbi:MAG: DUF4834 domain-containing protein [Flavobacteriaceae bacterium]|nr:DUF4834 domain-containing protein [Flavobacteriaceae bacterium]|tara:strand:- start:37093 stop:37347 length:255 start_codon:yes stop_codon:yes gene_type:complete
MGLLKTLFIIIFFYYAFKFLARLFAPFIVKKAADSMQRRAQEYQQRQSSQDTVREGETVIDRKPNGQKTSNQNVGEYVDFEEID